MDLLCPPSHPCTLDPLNPYTLYPIPDTLKQAALPLLHLPQSLRILHQLALPIDIFLGRHDRLLCLFLQAVGLLEASLLFLLSLLLSFLQPPLGFLLFLLDLLVGDPLHFGFLVLVHGG